MTANEFHLAMIDPRKTNSTLHSNYVIVLNGHLVIGRDTIAAKLFALLPLSIARLLHLHSTTDLALAIHPSRVPAPKALCTLLCSLVLISLYEAPKNKKGVTVLITICMAQGTTMNRTLVQNM